jgi:hypothetical protein
MPFEAELNTPRSGHVCLHRARPFAAVTGAPHVPHLPATDKVSRPLARSPSQLPELTLSPLPCHTACKQWPSGRCHAKPHTNGLPTGPHYPVRLKTSHAPIKRPSLVSTTPYSPAIFSLTVTHPVVLYFSLPMIDGDSSHRTSFFLAGRSWMKPSMRQNTPTLRCRTLLTGAPLHHACTAANHPYR